MVTVTIDEQGYTGHILLEPNISLSWQSNLRIFLIIALVTLSIASFFSLLGGWLVLPFSGLELLVFVTAIYAFFQRYNHCEVITFTDDKVVIEHGNKSPERAWVYQRYWSKIYVRGHGQYDIPKVSIKSHGKEMELGSFLGYDDKIEFIDSLKKITCAFQAHR